MRKGEKGNFSLIIHPVPIRTSQSSGILRQQLKQLQTHELQALLSPPRALATSPVAVTHAVTGFIFSTRKLAESRFTSML
jgi:hypothetical protein